MTAIEVNYQESINDNEEFFGTDLQAPLSQGKSTGWDIVVLTDFMAARLIRLGWVETIDTAGMKNFPKNLEDAYLTRSFDPGAKMTAPWQSGMTGLGFDAAKTGELDSIEAFWDAKYKGKVDYLSEMRDTVGLSAIRLGFDPGAITDEQYDQALAEVKKAIDSKLVRTIKGNDYLADLASGDVVLRCPGQAHPAPADKETVKFAVPKEGGMLWTDNAIPKGAENKKQAEAFIDFYYDPAIAARSRTS